jgi:two-component system phosphate regulon sensor histidine kinase PhoR
LRSLATAALGFAAMAGAAGAALGPWVAAAGIALLALLLLARHERQLKKLAAWAAAPLGTPLPAAGSSWSAAYLALQRRARQAAAQRDELQEMVERFRLAAEALPEGVLILDARLHIEWMNPCAESLLGLDGRQDVGRPLVHLMREPEFVGFIAAHGQGQGPAPLMVRPLRRPGHVLRVRSVPFSAGRTLLLIEDLTQLDRLETVRSDFVANVSHEMRTPLTVVQGFIETARDGLADPQHPVAPGEIGQYLDLALEHARRMERLIEDLLTLATLESGAPSAQEACAVAALLAGVRAEAEALSGGRHAIETIDTGPALLLGNCRELHSAFSNLASNAVRYTPAGGRIVLRWEATAEGGAAFVVEDSGIGIDSRHIPRLTERFYRVDRGRSRDSGGTGLGLAIVKHVLERHQATLAIQSRLGAGSSFSARFPAQRLG